jgi:propionyl-CoA synthetase
MSSYADTYRRSLKRPEEFWAEAAEAIDWERRWDRVLDTRGLAPTLPFPASRGGSARGRWFAGARLNTCWNALDRHVAAGRGERVALIWDSPVTGEIRHFTYRELRDEVARLAGVLTSLGVAIGDRVLIYMPMVPEAAMAMLACARIGAVHSVVFGGFAAHELAIRIDDAKPRVILSSSCGIEITRVIPYKPLLDAAIAEASAKPEHCVILQRPMCRAELMAGRDRDWHELVAAARPADCVPVLATEPLYILYTSGTTGVPKGVVRDNGGHAVALHWSLHNIYGVKPDEVFWTASDVGWVVGHSYIVYAPLLLGCTTVMYEGKPVGTPDAGAFWRVIEQHRVRVFFTAPTAFRAIKREDPGGELIRTRDLRHFRALFLAGERADPPTVAWAEEHLRIPVIDHWWQTETGWPIGANCLGIERLPDGQARLLYPARARLGRPRPRRRGGGDSTGAHSWRDRSFGDQVAIAAGRAADFVAGRRPFCRFLFDDLSRLLRDRRCRAHRRRWLHPRDDPHRRHHQCRCSPPVDRRDRRGAGGAPRCRRMRRNRRCRCAEGPGAVRLSGAQSRR